MDPDGVYKAGFATTQKAYEDAVLPLFDSLDKLEKILSGKDHLVGNQLTEADVRPEGGRQTVLLDTCKEVLLPRLLKWYVLDRVQCFQLRHAH